MYVYIYNYYFCSKIKPCDSNLMVVLNESKIPEIKKESKITIAIAPIKVRKYGTMRNSTVFLPHSYWNEMVQ